MNETVEDLNTSFPFHLIFLFSAVVVGSSIYYFFFHLTKKDQVKPPIIKNVIPEKKEKVKKEPAKKEPKTQKQESRLKLTSLKGHTKQLTSAVFSPNGKYVATTSEDRTLRIFNTKDFSEKAPNPIRINVPLDSASASAFTSDGNHILLALANSREILAYQLSSKKDEGGKNYKEVHRFPTEHQTPIKCLAISSNSKIVITSTEETTIFLWTIKGAKLEEINTSQMKMNMIAISPDSRFFAAATWTSDVRVWEIKYNKENTDYAGHTKAMQLNGHKSAVYCVDFSQNSSRAVTTSKDGTLKLWKIDVNYKIGGEASCLLTIDSPAESQFNLVAISPDSKVIAVTSGNQLLFYSMEGNLLEKADADHSEAFTSLSWGPDSKTIVTGGDQYATVWKSPLHV